VNYNTVLSWRNDKIMLTPKQKKDLDFILDFIKVGDALGMGFEYTSREYIENNFKDVDQFYPHPIWKETIKPGMYTDDTQMSMALVSLMGERNETEWFDDRVVAAAFLNEFKKDPRYGYSKALQNILISSRDWVDFLNQIRSHGDKSLKNGGCMRAVPLGVLDNLELVKRFGRFQAEITHKDSAVDAAEMVAVAAWFLYHADHRKDDSKSLNAFVKANTPWFPDLFKKQEYIPVGPDHNHVGMLTAQTAIAIAGEVIDKRCWSYGMEMVMDIGGDTDTVAAIVSGLWACYLCTMRPSARMHYHKEIDGLLTQIK
jgi:ADP-ribosylglycohydrolase